MMTASEKALAKKASEKGITNLEIYPNKVTFCYLGEYVKITKNNPSKEFIAVLKEIL